MRARLDPDSHEREVAGNDPSRLPVDCGGKALVVRSREDQQVGLLGVDFRAEGVGEGFKAVAGVFTQARGARLAVGDVVDVEPLHPPAVARELPVVERHGGEHHGTNRLAVHALMRVAGADRLQKAHRHGVRIHVDGKAVLLAVVDKALGDGLAVGLMVFADVEQRAGAPEPSGGETVVDSS